MYKIKYVFLILIFSFHAVSAENILAGKKNIKDILLDISEKIEGLEKTFLLPDNGFIEDGEASTALIELDILRIKLKKLEGELEKIEYELASQINSINENIKKISATIQKFDNSFVLDNIYKESNSKQIQSTYEDTNKNQLNDFQTLEKAKIHINNSEYENAKKIFKNFVTNFPNSSLLPEALYNLADIHYRTNDWKLAASTYLESFSLDPKGDYAPNSLFGLALSLGALKQFNQACLTLEEVNLRFPGQNVISIQNITETKKLLSC